MARSWPARWLVMYLVTTTAVIRSVYSAKSGVVSTKTTTGTRGESNSLAVPSSGDNSIWKVDSPNESKNCCRTH